MIFKLRTSKKTLEIFTKIQNSTAIAPFALVKIAIALSIKDNTKLCELDFLTDNLGLELNRQTITGEYDELYKALIIINEGENLLEDEYFPKYIKAHIDRGAVKLEAEFKYGGNFIEHLANLDLSI